MRLKKPLVAIGALAVIALVIGISVASRKTMVLPEPFKLIDEKNGVLHYQCNEDYYSTADRVAKLYPELDKGGGIDNAGGKVVGAIVDSDRYSLIVEGPTTSTPPTVSDVYLEEHTYLDEMLWRLGLKRRVRFGVEDPISSP